ncbi:MAG: NADH-quinone oxidoreductase subunit N [Nitrospirae bacterium GWD2_57_9]|nr:MAG: NADH-quinone oxidoreductase subunit N [Nitrospirae bacterium GWD2_57_9]OGW46368.1 MAG: NADH-quinone oxidoreductase subunit N [Nitrospirae bacterium GWC2_57_9]
MNTAISISGLKALLPFLIMTAAAMVVMLGIAFRRDHRFTVLLTLAGLALGGGSLVFTPFAPDRYVTTLVLVDAFAGYYLALLFAAAFAVVCLSYSYLEIQGGHREEYYLLVLLAVLGAAVLAAATHFASFFLGIEILSVSLYGLTAYQRHRDQSVEAGVKYLILAAVSSAFILFGMALVYAEVGSMEFARIAIRAGAAGGALLGTGLVLIIVGLGFKLAVVPFHLWTPDVYEGAPAPVTAFIATVSKGAVFALVLRFFGNMDIRVGGALFLIFTIIAVASMFFGNLLALMQQNVKRVLAYSSISHIGYLLVTLLAAGPLRLNASAFYLAAYFVTTLGVFGVVTVLSTRDRDADKLDDYRGLAWRRPWLAGVFTAMLLSLAGIPLTAGFIAKFYLVAAGIGSALWLLVIVLIVNSAIGLFYYLRIIGAVYSMDGPPGPSMPISLSGSAALGGLTLALLWLGIYPGPFLALIGSLMQTAH